MRLIPVLSLQVTYQCNIECRHCGPFCGLKERDWMTVDEIKDLIKQADELGCSSVVFTGGEPTLLGKNLTDILRFVRDETSISSTRIVTNGKWATSYLRAHRMLKEWKDAGLVEVNISCGEYHQEFVSVDCVINGFRAARDLDYKTVVMAGEFLDKGKGKFSPKTFTDALGEELVPYQLLSPYLEESHTMTCGSAMNYGRGKEQLNPADLRFEDEDVLPSLCSDVLGVITAHPNGKTTACCGIMVREESLLNLGDWRENRLKPLVEAANEDIILNWIRYVGLKDMKRWLKEKDPTIPFREKYINICDLCAEIVYDKRCQELLIEHGQERADDIIANKVAMDATVYDVDEFCYTRPEVQA